MDTVRIKNNFVFDALDTEDLMSLSIVRLNRNSVIFFNRSNGKDYFATKRVAQKILDGDVKYAIIEYVCDPKTGHHKPWLALPSRF